MGRRDDIAAGDRVIIGGFWLLGQQGSLLNGKRAWLVQVDDGKSPLAFRGRNRVGVRILHNL